MNPYQRYREEMDRAAKQVAGAAKLAFARGDVMRGRVKPEDRRSFEMRQYSVRMTAAKRRLGVRSLCLEREKPLIRVQLESVTDTNDGVYVSPRLEKPRSLTEVAHWLNKVSWNITMCGRCAVGVGLLRREAADLPGEKVYQATCKDWMCAACNAKRMAHEAPALKQLMLEEFGAGQRLFFATLTVSHKFHHTLVQTRAVLDRAWALLIRRAWFKRTFDERLRVGESEFTKAAGFHPHFHLLLRLKADCKASHWERAKIYAELRRLWRLCTANAGRESWKVDLRELVAVRDDQGDVTAVRYWLRPEEREKFEDLERAGLVKLYRNGRHLSREQTLNDVADELCKYITKVHGDGKKTNQVPLADWKPWMVLEYRLGMRYWNRRRASRGWEQRLLELKESASLEREIEEDQAGGYEYLPWAAIAAMSRKAASGKLTRQEAVKFAADFPRIHEALSREGCDISANMIEGYIAHFFGNTSVPLQKLLVTPWEKSEWREEELARKCEEAELQKRLKARHWRVLLRVRRRLDQGNSSVAVSGMGMSRHRLTGCLDDLRRDGLLESRMVMHNGKQREHYALTDSGRRLLPTTIPDPAAKHAARKALRDVQRMLPGMLFQEEN